MEGEEQNKRLDLISSTLFNTLKSWLLALVRYGKQEYCLLYLDNISQHPSYHKLPEGTIYFSKLLRNCLNGFYYFIF